jgi:HAD superfamily hydrolase (TIGR01509 family)
MNGMRSKNNQARLIVPYGLIQAIIFDLDGLLIDSEPCWDRVRQQMAAEYGQTWTQDNQRSVMGVSTATWADYMIERLRLSLTQQAVIERIVGKMLALYHEHIPYLPGAVEAVHWAAKHYPTALASGSERSLIEAVVQDPAMRGQFQVVVCTDDLPCGKPAPDVYLEAARRLGVDPEVCVCVEDSPNGIMAGKAAGMKVIAVPDMRFNPNREVIRQADVVLGSLEEFSLELIIDL